MKQIELDRRNCELNAEFENRRAFIRRKEVELQIMIEEVKLGAEQKLCEYRKKLHDLSLAYQELKADIANRRESLLIEAQSDGEKTLDS